MLAPSSPLLSDVTQRAWIQHSCWEHRGARAAPHDTSAFPGGPSGVARGLLGVGGIAGNGQSSPGVETWSCPDPTGSSGIPPSTGVAWGAVFTPVLASPREPALETGDTRQCCTSGTGTVPRGRGRCGEGTNPPVTALLWDMHVLWAAAVMEQAFRRAFLLLLLLLLSQPRAAGTTPAAAAGQEPPHSSFPSPFEPAGAQTPLGEGPGAVGGLFWGELMAGEDHLLCPADQGTSDPQTPSCTTQTLSSGDLLEHWGTNPPKTEHQRAASSRWAFSKQFSPLLAPTDHTQGLEPGLGLLFVELGSSSLCRGGTEGTGAPQHQRGLPRCSCKRLVL